MHKVSWLLLVVLLAGTLLGNPGAAVAAQTGVAGPGSQPIATPIDPAELEAFLDGLIGHQLAASHIAGATVAVVQDGQVLLAKGYGYANVEQGIPVSPEQTLFRPGSISKLFVWTAVMQLVEQGKLDLNADVNTYLANASPALTIPDTFPQPITLAHLMTHSPGFEEQGLGTMARNAEEMLPLGEYLAAYMPQRVRPPGELSAYSNYGTALAGYIIGLVSGMPYEQYIEENILQPLQMTHSTFYQPVPESLVANAAQGYKHVNGVFEAQDFEYIQAAPAGALSATAGDMAHFMLAHLQDGQYDGARILQPETVAEMHARQFAHDPAVSGWGYGFYESLANGLRGIGHGGDTQYFHSELILLPDQQLGAFVSYNSSEGGLAALEFLASFVNHYFPAERAALPEPDAQATYQRYVGSYLAARSNYSTPEKITGLFSQVNVSLTPENRLLVSLAFPGQMPAQYVEVSPRVFAPVDPGAVLFGRLAFREDAQGNITHLFFENNPTSAYIRLPWYASANFNLALLGLCLGLFVTVAIFGPVVALANRRLKIQQSGLPMLARLLAWGLCLLNVLFLIGFMAMMSNPEIAYGLTTGIKLLLLLPLVSVALTLVLVVLTVMAWRGVLNIDQKPYWGLLARLHFTLVTLAALAYLWWMAYWELLRL